MDVRIRNGERTDLPVLTNLYNYYVRHTPATFDIEPRSLADRTRWFGLYGLTGPYRLFVAERDGQVVGYASSNRFHSMAAYVTSVQTSIYLAPDATGQGIGSRLYAALFEALRRESVHRAYAGVTLPNPASIGLHRRFGFEEVGIYREVGRKFGRYWSVLWFEKAMEWEVV